LTREKEGGRRLRTVLEGRREPSEELKVGDVREGRERGRKEK